MKIEGGNPKIITKGLMFHLDAENPSCYSGTGTTAYDISKFRNTATLTNASVGTTTSGVFTFNGSYITFDRPFPQYDNLKQQWTVQSWVKRARETGYAYCIENWNRDLCWEFSTTLKPLNYLNSSPNDSYAYGQIDDFAEGVWRFSTFTFDRVNYVNGRVTTQKDLDSPSVGGNLSSTDIPAGIGTSLNYGSNCVNTESKNLLIYNRELTSAEITHNYNVTKERYGI